MTEDAKLVNRTTSFEKVATLFNESLMTRKRKKESRDVIKSYTSSKLFHLGYEARADSVYRLIVRLDQARAHPFVLMITVDNLPRSQIAGIVIDLTGILRCICSERGILYSHFVSFGFTVKMEGYV